eukprot:211947-Chlamydomonas_euryale.AAC.1
MQGCSSSVDFFGRETGGAMCQGQAAALVRIWVGGKREEELGWDRMGWPRMCVSAGVVSSRTMPGHVMFHVGRVAG